MQRLHACLTAQLALALLASSYGCSTGSKGSPADAADASDARSADSAPPDAAGDLSVDLLDAVDSDTPFPSPDFLWQAGAEPLVWPTWISDHPWLLDVAPWSHRLEEKPSNPPELRYFGDLAVGNGSIFSFVGYQGPFNRFHSMVGPSYERGPQFFSDAWLEVVPESGNPYAWQREWLGRVRQAPIVLTAAEQSSLRLFTVDAALMTDKPTDPLSRAILRVAVLKNRTDKPLQGLTLSVRFARDQVAGEQAVVETLLDKTRTVKVLSGGTGVPLAKELAISIPDIGPQGEHVVVLAFVVSDSDEPAEPVFAGLLDAAAEPALLLQDTHSRWKDRLSAATTIETPDPMVDGYLETQLIVSLSQQSAGGAICPMSQYTHAWMRDTAGPARLLISLGLFEELRRNLDYIWYGSVEGGGLQNAYPADLMPVLPVNDQPDWASMGTMKDHLKAETPSHIPLMHYWYWMASGKLDFMPERVEMMKHSMWKQQFDGDLLPFSGDETYRAAMAVAHDLSLLEQFEVGFDSAFSSFLWVVGAETMIALCDAAGADCEQEKLATRMEEMRTAMNDAFLTKDGAYVPYVKTPSLEQAPKLFEDVSMFPTWLGLLPPDDPIAVSNLKVAIDQIGGEDGILISPLPASYENILGLPVEKGIYTGMNPGHYLWALAAARHHLAEKAFNAMRLHATPTGTTPEYQILDDFSPLHLLYGEMGQEPADYTARYRPWEGGINAEAVVFYLLGLRQDAPAMTLTLAPHLPNGWHWLDARSVRVGDTRIDVRFERPDDSAWKVTLSHQSGETLTVKLDLPFDDGIDVEATTPQDPGPPTVTANGQPHGAEVFFSPWGTPFVRLAPVEVTPGTQVVMVAVP